MYDEPTAGLGPRSVHGRGGPDAEHARHEPEGRKRTERRTQRGRAELHRGDAPALDHPPRGGPLIFLHAGKVVWEGTSEVRHYGGAHRAAVRDRESRGAHRVLNDRDSIDRS